MNTSTKSGWLIKNLETGKIDFGATDPVTTRYAKGCPLRAGFIWVKVAIVIVEVKGDL